MPSAEDEDVGILFSGGYGGPGYVCTKQSEATPTLPAPYGFGCIVRAKRGSNELR